MVRVGRSIHCRPKRLANGSPGSAAVREVSGVAADQAADQAVALAATSHLAEAELLTGPLRPSGTAEGRGSDSSWRNDRPPRENRIRRLRFELSSLAFSSVNSW
ncbi:hypothetical protein Psuf_094310 [Phytohabitans suffuscus]|uniref:Uncharacterized protein n=1 Tax=Phytohabitans suffuscus TaxID=624315 RepID=A0A6F8Z1R7_9ACTN|nr:hypothetical protein Psuf_094310 [Phytohabitans suffuscus]